MKNLLYIGPAPQNIGGISINIRRLVGLLKGVFNIDFVDEGHVKYDGFFNLRSFDVITYIKKVKKSDVVHIHSGTWMLRAFHIVICKVVMRKKVLVTVHRDPNREPHLWLTKGLLKVCDYAILVNKEGYDTMLFKSKCKYVLLPAFLPPVMDEEPPLPEGIVTWIRNIRNTENAYLMCSNAWNLVLHDGQDLYGLDMCIEALKKLDKNVFILFVVASNTDQQERMALYKEDIKKSGLEKNIMIWEKPASFVRIVQQSDLVLRTTNTDGDAISIREALYFGKPVLASDVVKRPEGTYLFKTRDTDDLVRKVVELQSLKEERHITQAVDYRSVYLKMYEH